MSPHHGIEKKKRTISSCNVRDTRECVRMQLYRIYKKTLLRGRRRGASAPAGPRDENSPDAPKYFVVIVRDSSSTNAAGLKLFDRTLATSGQHTQIAPPTLDPMMHTCPRECTRINIIYCIDTQTTYHVYKYFWSFIFLN